MVPARKSRLGVRLDMTAMVDVAFLLLTFFMLTTTFRPPEEVSVDVPISHSQLKLPTANVITLTVTKTGSLWMDVDAQVVRAKIFGPEFAQRSGKQITLGELPELITQARMENLAIRGMEGAMRVVVKADRRSEYAMVSRIMDILQKNNISSVNFLTNKED